MGQGSKREGPWAWRWRWRGTLSCKGEGGERGVAPRGGACANGKAAALSTPPALARPFRCWPSKPPLSLASLAQLLSSSERASELAPRSSPPLRGHQSAAPQQQSVVTHTEQPWQPLPWPPPGARPPPPWPRPPSSTSPCVTAPRRWLPPSACAPRPPASAAASRTASRASWTLGRPPPSCSPPPPSSPMYAFTLLLLFT